MPVWAIVLIIVGSILLVEAIVFVIIHRRLIKAIIKGTPRPKAPRWHFWIPKKNRRP